MKNEAWEGPSGSGPLPMDQLEALRDAFSASDLPILVDVLDEHAVSPAFRARIDACFEVIQVAIPEK